MIIIQCGGDIEGPPSFLLLTHVIKDVPKPKPVLAYRQVVRFDEMLGAVPTFALLGVATELKHLAKPWFNWGRRLRKMW